MNSKGVRATGSTLNGPSWSPEYLIPTQSGSNSQDVEPKGIWLIPFFEECNAKVVVRLRKRSTAVAVFGHSHQTVRSQIVLRTTIQWLPLALHNRIQAILENLTTPAPYEHRYPEIPVYAHISLLRPPPQITLVSPTESPTWERCPFNSPGSP